ncbi:MAG TPA: DUF5683 domain-containing protein [Fulvivirga sp.]|nr:DUF5683 domain-containing protein [Fulvivirga sp.]
MRTLFLFGCLLFSLPVICQVTPASVVIDSTRNDDPILIEKDNQVNIEEIETYADKFVPRKASLYASVLPGAGQIYNKKYWKLPIVYGGFIGLGLAINFYDKQYDLYRSQLFKKLQDNSYVPPSGANLEQLRSAVDKSRRERDFYTIMTGLWYLLQILDAHIDSHLKEFDLNPDLKVAIDPMLERPAFANFSAGISIKLKF